MNNMTKMGGLMPIMTSTIIDRYIEVNDDNGAEMRFPLPRMGVLLGIELQCSKGRKVIKRVKFEVNGIHLLVDLPWPLYRKRRMTLEVGSMAGTAPNLLGVFLQNMALDPEVIVQFAPGDYSVDFRIISQWVPIEQ